MVLALLFKIGSSKRLDCASSKSLLELLSKAESFVSKLELETEKSILITIDKLKSSLSEAHQNNTEPQQDDELLDEYSMHYKEGPVQASRGSKRRPTLMTQPKKSQGLPKSAEKQIAVRKNFVIRGASKSPQIMPRGTTPVKERLARSTQASPNPDSRRAIQSGYQNSRVSGKQAFRMSTRKSITDSIISHHADGNHEPATQKLLNDSHIKLGSRQVRKEFKESLENLLKLGEYVKSEINEMKDEPRMTIVKIKKKPKPNSIFDDSDEMKQDIVDKAVSAKLNQLLDKQLEWQQNRDLLQQKLEKIEKAIDRQKTNDEAGGQAPFATPKNGTDAWSPIDIGNVLATNFLATNSYLSPKVNYQRDKKSSSNSNNFLSVGRSNSMASQNPSVASEISNRSQVVTKGTEGYMSALKFALHQLDKGSGDFDEEFKQILVCGKEQKLSIGLKIIEGTRTEDGHRLMLTLYTWSQSTSDLSMPANMNIVQQDLLDIEQVAFILKNINAAEVLPSHRPAPTFTSMKFFLVHVLGKFLQVVASDNSSQLDTIAIQKIPQSLIVDEVITTGFFGEEHTITLLHIHEKAFRLILRKTSEGEQGEGIFADLIFNDFVMSQFFEVVCMSTSQYQKWMGTNTQPTEEELINLKISPEASSKSIQFISTVEKRVTSSNPG